ncbi:8692_t:CDS:2, partial [Cetraspora pellucida]
YRELKRFTEKLLGSAKEDHIKRPAISSVKNRFKNLDDYLIQPKENYSEPVKQEFQPIDDENALVNGANLAIAKYGWLQIRRIKKGHFILKYYWQKQYKPNHKGLSFDKVLDTVESKKKPKL